MPSTEGQTLQKARPVDDPDWFNRIDGDRWGAMLVSMMLVSNVGCLPAARTKAKNLKTLSVVLYATRKYFRDLDTKSKVQGWLENSCSPQAASFVTMWQAGCIAGHKEEILEAVAREIHSTEALIDYHMERVAARVPASEGVWTSSVPADDKSDDEGQAELEGSWDKLIAAMGVKSVSVDDDDSDDEVEVEVEDEAEDPLPPGASAWCACQYCAQAVYAIDKDDFCDYCWPVGTTCQCQL